MKRWAGFPHKSAILVLGLMLAGVLPSQAAEPGLKVSPATVQIGAFFNGQTRMFRPERIARASASTQVAPDLVPSAAPQG